MNRRDILKIVGLVSAWPAIGRAQPADMPVIGFLSSGSKADRQDQVDAFLRGLKEAGRKVGENLVIEYRWADDRDDHFQALALEIVRLKPAVIAVSSSTAIALSVKCATTTIPIVFCVGGDPVKNGLVASLNRPGGNVTGISYLSNALAPKRLELLRELTPKQTVIAHLVNPKNSNAKADVDEMVAAAHAVGLQIVLFEASNTRELDVSFLSMAQQRSAPSSLHRIQCFLASVQMLSPYPRNTKSLPFLMAKNTPTRAVLLVMAQIAQQHFGPQVFVSVGF